MMSRSTCLLLAAAAGVYVMIDGPGVAPVRERVRALFSSVAAQPAPMPTPQPASSPSTGVAPSTGGGIVVA